MSRRLSVVDASHALSAVERRRAEAIAETLAYHGAGLTFGELAIGELFEWAAPIPNGGEPLIKTNAACYQWSRGHGMAEDYYRVERWEGPHARDEREPASGDDVPQPR